MPPTLPNKTHEMPPPAFTRPTSSAAATSPVYVAPVPEKAGDKNAASAADTMRALTPSRPVAHVAEPKPAAQPSAPAPQAAAAPAAQEAKPAKAAKPSKDDERAQEAAREAQKQAEKQAEIDRKNAKLEQERQAKAAKEQAKRDAEQAKRDAEQAKKDAEAARLAAIEAKKQAELDRERQKRSTKPLPGRKLRKRNIKSCSSRRCNNRRRGSKDDVDGTTRRSHRHGRRRFKKHVRPAAALGRRPGQRRRRRAAATARRPTSSSSTSAATRRRRWPASSGCARARRAPASSPWRSAADPDLILQAMRAGANEFFTWPPADETFHGAIRRTAARRETAQGAKPAATTLVFFGAKGGAGTTTVAVNCGVELARLSKRPTVIVDLKPGLGEVALFLGVRPRYSLLDAIDNLHRLDREFLRELVVKHKSGLEILAGSDHFDRPGAADARRHRRAVPAARAAVRVHRRRRRQPDQLVLGRRALRRRPHVPGRQSRRAVGAQRAAAARARARARRLRRARPRCCSTAPPSRIPIPPKQIETRARPPDSSHVPERLQDGVDGAQLGRAAGADRQLRDRDAVRSVHAAHARSRAASRRRPHAPKCEPARPRAARVPLVNHR